MLQTLVKFLPVHFIPHKALREVSNRNFNTCPICLLNSQIDCLIERIRKIGYNKIAKWPAKHRMLQISGITNADYRLEFKKPQVAELLTRIWGLRNFSDKIPQIPATTKIVRIWGLFCPPNFKASQILVRISTIKISQMPNFRKHLESQNFDNLKG